MDGDPFGLLGTVLDGKFRVDALVGHGDLSVVYKGHHVALDAPVAIKCLHLPDTLDPELTRPVVEAFEESGRLHDRLGRGSLHVAQTIAVGRTTAPSNGSTVPYRVREWFEGESLASDLARRRRRGDRPRTVEEAFALLAPAIDGIAHAHDEGIAHLSLDPGNLFLARDEGPCSLKVLDFGTARASHHADARPTLDSELTRGLHLLHPAYAAPEQLDMDLGEPGTWTDVYALAVIMMEVLAGRSSLEARDTAALVNRALDKQVRPTPQAHGLKLPGALDLVLTRAVARSPEARQKNARVFLNELKAAVGHPPHLAPEPPRVRAIEPAPQVLASSTTLPRTWEPPRAAPDPARLDRKLVRRHSSRRALGLGVCAAAFAVGAIVAVLFAFLRARRASETAATTPRMTPSAAAPVAPPAAAPVAPIAASAVARTAVAATAIAAPPTVPVASDERAARPHAAASPPLPRFSRAAARHAMHSAVRKAARCRHGKFWGHGYATIVFANDGSVDRVLVDPPFSMTVTGKCVADALGVAHIGAFEGPSGYYRLRFYIARR